MNEPDDIKLMERCSKGDRQAFDRLLAMWVFMATMLTSTVLIPITAGLFYKGRKTKLAGLLACAFGFVGSITYYLSLYTLGSFDENYATYIWNFTIGGFEFSIWQEYALFFTLPFALAGFILGNLFGHSVQAPPAVEVPA